MTSLLSSFIEEKYHEGLNNIHHKIKNRIGAIYQFTDKSLHLTQIDDVFIHFNREIPITTDPLYSGYVLTRLNDGTHSFYCFMNQQACNEYQNFTGQPLNDKNSINTFVQVRINGVGYINEKKLDSLIRKREPIRFLISYMANLKDIEDDSNDMKLIPIFEADRCLFIMPSFIRGMSKMIAIENVKLKDRSELIVPISREEKAKIQKNQPKIANFVQTARAEFLSPNFSTASDITIITGPHTQVRKLVQTQDPTPVVLPRYSFDSSSEVEEEADDYPKSVNTLDIVDNALSDKEITIAKEDSDKSDINISTSAELSLVSDELTGKLQLKQTTFDESINDERSSPNTQLPLFKRLYSSFVNSFRGSNSQPETDGEENSYDSINGHKVTATMTQDDNDMVESAKVSNGTLDLQTDTECSSQVSGGHVVHISSDLALHDQSSQASNLVNNTTENISIVYATSFETSSDCDPDQYSKNISQDSNKEKNSISISLIDEGDNDIEVVSVAKINTHIQSSSQEEAKEDIDERSQVSAVLPDISGSSLPTLLVVDSPVNSRQILKPQTIDNSRVDVVVNTPSVITTPSRPTGSVTQYNDIVLDTPVIQPNSGNTETALNTSLSQTPGIYSKRPLDKDSVTISQPVSGHPTMRQQTMDRLLGEKTQTSFSLPEKWPSTISEVFRSADSGSKKRQEHLLPVEKTHKRRKLLQKETFETKYSKTNDDDNFIEYEELIPFIRSLYS